MCHLRIAKDIKMESSFIQKGYCCRVWGGGFTSSCELQNLLFLTTRKLNWKENDLITQFDVKRKSLKPLTWKMVCFR